jgi:hypothetical protein
MSGMPEPIATDDADTVLWRVRGRVRDSASCVWCGATTRFTWMRESEHALRKLGFACSALCAERRERRPAT